MSSDDSRYYSSRALLLALLVGVLIGALLTPRSLFRPRHIDASTTSKKLQGVLELVDQQYVDDIDRDSAVVAITNAVMKSLDPHSRYIAAHDFERELSDIRGNFYGIGAMLRSQQDSVIINHAMEGSPARRANLRTGDRIVAVDDTTVSGVKMSIDDVIDKIRGPRHTTVKLTIVRPGANDTMQVMVDRDIIATHSVIYSDMMPNGVGYIHLQRFSETSVDEVDETLRALTKRGMKHLILDLRSNGGGLLSAATSIADMFLKRGALIVYTEGAHQKRHDSKASGRGEYQDLPLTIMIDEFSASASEVLAGAIQDNDRGTIVGRRSFGKGLVQQQFEFSDHSAVLLTVARYYSPSGRCIQRPYNKGTDEYYNEYLKRVLSDNSSDTALASVTDTTVYHTVNGRVVYGGGGIYPDHVLKYSSDTLRYYINKLVNSRIADSVAFAYTVAHYDELMQRFPDYQSWRKAKHNVSSLRQQVVEAGSKAGIAPQPLSLARHGHRIDVMITSYIAEYLYGMESFYAGHLTIDDDMASTLALIKK